MKNIRVLIVDDHAILRAGLSALLKLQPDMEVVGEASDGPEALDKIDKLQPEVVLMDITLPGLEGLEVTKKLKEAHPNIKVLILTMHEDRHYLSPSLKAGASGYVVKRAADRELIDAIRAVHRGDTFLHPSVAKFVAEDYVKHGATEPSLSDRELDVLKLIAEGRTYKEMADLLNLSVKTIETYRERIKEKLTLNTRAELVRYALENGLLRPKSRP